jgi:hypothetical protein
LAGATGATGAGTANLTGFSAYSSTALSGVTTGVVVFNNVLFDDNSPTAYSTANNYFAAPAAGLYHFDAAVRLSGEATAGLFIYIALQVNGSTVKYVSTQTSTSTFGVSISADLKLNSSDQVQVYLACSSAFTTSTVSTATWFCGHRIY